MYLMTWETVCLLIVGCYKDHPLELPRTTCRCPDRDIRHSLTISVYFSLLCLRRSVMEREERIGERNKKMARRKGRRQALCT
jgi:hypothetical protein